jgi:hypothetical protein
MLPLTQAQFQTAFAHGAVQSVEIEPSGARFAVKVLTQAGDAMLVQARSAEPRLFGTVDSALKLLHKLGVRRIVLDRAEALTRAAEYDRWVQAKVQASRDDPRPTVADDEWQAVRAARLAARKAVTLA